MNDPLGLWAYGTERLHTPRMRPRKWTEHQLREAVRQSQTVRQVLQRIGLAPYGGNYAVIKRQLNHLRLDTSHFLGQGWRKGRVGTLTPIRPLRDILTKGVAIKSYELKLRLLVAGLKAARCEECGWAERTPEGHLPVEPHHINGDPEDNRLENLQILCPNCHSLKPYYRSRIRT